MTTRKGEPSGPSDDDEYGADLDESVNVAPRRRDDGRRPAHEWSGGASTANTFQPRTGERSFAEASILLIVDLAAPAARDRNPSRGPGLAVLSFGHDFDAGRAHDHESRRQLVHLRAWGLGQIVSHGNHLPRQEPDRRSQCEKPGPAVSREEEMLLPN